MNHHQRLQGIVRRVRRECEEVGETGVEEAVGAEAVVAGLRVELGAALAELGPESTASGYDRERDRLAAEIAACEAQVSRLEAVVRTDRILDEIEALVSSNALSAAAKKLSSFPPRGDDVLRRRKRGLAAALEVRLTDLAAAAIDITASRLVFRHRYAGLIQNAPIDDDDDDDGTSLSSVLRNLGLIGAARRFLRTLAAELEPVLDRAVILTDLSTPDAGELAIEPAPLEEKDAFRTRAASATVWVRFMRETLGLDDETICYLDGWTAKRLEEVVRADASSVDRETLLALDVRPLALPKRLFEEALNTYAQVRATKALDDARDLILGDWHNDSEVDADDILDELEGCAGGRSGGDSFFSEKKKKKGMRVSVLAQEFVAQAERLLQDAVGATAPEAARALFFTTRQLFELYRALFPLAHADTIHAQARMATLFRNDCLFLIRAATRFSVRYCPEIAARGSGDDALLTLVDQLPPLRDLANELLFCPPPAARPAYNNNNNNKMWEMLFGGEGGAGGEEKPPERLAELHAKFRADLEAAPLDELKEAARAAAHANVGREAAGGWRITAALAMMRNSSDPPVVAEVAELSRPQSVAEVEARPSTFTSESSCARWGELSAFDDGVGPSRWGVAAGAVEDREFREIVKVEFLDGSSFDQPMPRGTAAFDLLRRAASRLGVDPRDAGALALFYSEEKGRLGRVVAPAEPIAGLGPVVLAVRLVTEPIHAAARRGLRGSSSSSSSRAEIAIARLVYAQAVAAAMSGALAVLPCLGEDSDCPATDPRAAPARARLGAWRLWSRARDVVTTTSSGDNLALWETARRLVARHGAAAFCPPPACDDDDLLAELDGVVASEETEIEIAEGAAGASNAAPCCVEALYLDLVARSPAYGATLFACRKARRLDEAGSEYVEGAPRRRWLAISRRGASILSADASARLHDIPLECARRWREHPEVSSILLLEYERPPNRWPSSAARRADRLPDDERAVATAAKNDDDDDDDLWSYFGAAPNHSLPPPKRPPPVVFDSSRRVDGVDSDLAPVMRVGFELEIDDSRAAAGGAAEAVSLLDDYCLCDLAETPPTFGWDDKKFPKRAALPGFYDALVSAVVRPPRFNYDSRLLGPSSFRFGGCRFHRDDVVLANRRGERIHVSRWRPDDDLSSESCVVFVHANSASRAQCCHYLSLVLSLGCALVAFDCAGSGLSDGSLVTLGWREAHDLRVVLEWLKPKSVALWGQSMGAAAAIYYQGIAEQDWPRLDAVVLDSPYSDFSQLATHIANERRALFAGFSLPTLVLDLLLSSLDASVQKKAGFSPLQKLSPLAHASRCSVPALFVRARKDPLISQDHVEQLAKRYAGPRTLALVEGTHSSPRDLDARKFIGRFLERHLPIQDHRRLPPRAVERHLQSAPWLRPRPSAAAAAAPKLLQSD